MSPSRSIDSGQSETSKVEVGETSPLLRLSKKLHSLQSKEVKFQAICQEEFLLISYIYIVAPGDLNTLLFSPDSKFPKALADLQGTTELQVGPWKSENGGESSKRSLTYLKAAIKFMNAVKGYEDQTYLKADGKNLAVLAIVSILDVMYGSTFREELLYVIIPGPELPSEEQCSRLVISWRMKFVQSTMMRGKA